LFWSTSTRRSHTPIPRSSGTRSKSRRPRGHDAVRANLAHWEGEWDDYEVIPEEFLDLGDRVVVTVRLRGRGHGSGVEIDARFYEIYTLREGKIIRMDEFTDRADALEAAGPAE
jgi:ketosteroid isomerase-like protein